MSAKTTRARVAGGVPAGGQFAPDTRAEPELTLEAMADALGDEDPTFDPDDPYGADLLDDVDLARAMLPAPYVVTDAFALAAPVRTRAQVHEAIERYQRIIDGAPADRLGLSDRGERDKLVAFDDATQQAEVDLDAAYAELEMFERAADDVKFAGLMSIDDMTPAQRTQIDAVYARAFDFAYAAIGTDSEVIDTSDEAEEFAAFAARTLVDNQFDETGFELTRTLARFDADRAGKLAAGFANGPRHTQWAREMASLDGFNSSVATSGGWDKRARRDLIQFTDYLAATGFRIEERPDPRGSGDRILRITGGRPAPSAAA